MISLVSLKYTNHSFDNSNYMPQNTDLKRITYTCMNDQKDNISFGANIRTTTSINTLLKPFKTRVENFRLKKLKQAEELKQAKELRKAEKLLIPNIFDELPIHLDISNGDIESLKSKLNLAKKYPDIQEEMLTKQDFMKCHPFQRAIINEEPEMAELILNSPGDRCDLVSYMLTAPNNNLKDFPLDSAIYHGLTELSKSMLNKAESCSVNTLYRMLLTEQPPFHIALWKKDTEVAKLIYNTAKKEPTLLYKILNQQVDGNTAFNIIAVTDNIEMAKLILDADLPYLDKILNIRDSIDLRPIDRAKAEMKYWFNKALKRLEKNNAIME